MKVEVYHNVATTIDGKHAGMLYGFQPGDPLVLVAEYLLTSTRTEREEAQRDACEHAWREFSPHLTHDHTTGRPSLTAVTYQARGNRPLTVGDVLAIDGHFFWSSGMGWRPMDAPANIINFSATAPLGSTLRGTVNGTWRG